MGIVGKKQPDPEPEEETGEDDREQKQMLKWRRRCAVEAGMSPLEARMFAESDIDLEELRRLVKTGCPAEMIGRILL